MRRRGIPVIDRLLFTFLVLGNPVTSQIFQLSRQRTPNAIGLAGCCILAGLSIYFIGISEYGALAARITLAILACFVVAAILHFAMRRYHRAT